MSTQNVLFDAPGPKAKRRYLLLSIVGVVVLIGFIWFVLKQMKDAEQLHSYMWTPFLHADIWVNYLLLGLWGTVKAALISIVLAVVFGIIFGLGRLSSITPIRWICGAVVEIFRAIPVLIMMIFAFYFYVDNGIWQDSLNPLAAVVTGLTLYNGAVIAELVRSGVYALPKGQREAGLSIGLTPGQSLRSIELPQALTAMLPALVSQLVVILKDSALGTAITYTDLLTWGSSAGSAFANTLPVYIVLIIIYVVLNYMVTWIAGRIERRINRRGKTAGGTVETPLPGAAAEGAA